MCEERRKQGQAEVADRRGGNGRNSAGLGRTPGCGGWDTGVDVIVGTGGRRWKSKGGERTKRHGEVRKPGEVEKRTREEAG